MGAIASSQLELLTKPLVLAAGTGALIGVLAAKRRDSGLPDKRFKMIGEGPILGSSAISAVIDHHADTKAKE